MKKEQNITKLTKIINKFQKFYYFLKERKFH